MSQWTNQDRQLLIGRTITGFRFNEDRESLTLETDQGVFRIDVHGD